jgi:hypothetical protein
MEYLMTYGWAILIIAVVLAALFSLNVFNAGASLGGGNPCIGQAGVACSAASLNHLGLLSFTLGNGGTSGFYNVMVSCEATSNSTTATALNFNSITAGGAAYGPASVNVGGKLPTGSGNVPAASTLPISGVQCWPTSGSSIAIIGTTYSPIGTSFTGVIWIAYNTSGGTGPANQYAKIATIATKSSS